MDTETIAMTKRVDIDNETFLKAMHTYETPEKFYDQARIMLTNEEMIMIAEMGPEAVSHSALVKIIKDNNLAEDPEELITYSWRKSVLNKEKKEGSDEMHYKITSFYGLVSSYCRWESEVYRTFPKDVIDQINDYVFEVALGQHRKTILNRMNGIGFEDRYLQSDFLTLQEALQAIDEAKGPFHLVPCDCKSLVYYHHKNNNVCLNIGARSHSLNGAATKGLGEEISREEAKELVKRCNSQGLMQVGEHDGFCNCDGVCCFPIRRGKYLGARGIYPQAHWKIDFHEDECNHCGICAKLCNFGAFQYDAYKHVTFNPDKCYGCTICSSNCPKDAIHLIRTGARPVPGFLLEEEEDDGC